MLDQQSTHARCFGDVENRGDGGAIVAGPHQFAVGPFAECEAQRLDEDRFAGAGFARQYRQTRAELDIDMAHHDKVLHGQGLEQGFRPPS